MKDMERGDLKYKQDNYNLNLDNYKFHIQSMRSWANEWFESEESKVMFGTFFAFVGLAPIFRSIIINIKLIIKQ
jgi:hypothetical protein